eukprot:SAG22_NODE_250_length_13779_cov_6.413450_14_plen_99_part_00
MDPEGVSAAPPGAQQPAAEHQMEAGGGQPSTPQRARDRLLERHFADVETEPNANTIEMLAAATSLTTMQVAGWFSARRRHSELSGGQRGCEFPRLLPC